MHLDLRTISILISISSLTFGVSILMVSAGVARGLRGGRTWAYACLVMSAGFLLTGLRGFLDDGFAIIVGNTLLILASVLFYDALLVFRGKKRLRLATYLFTVIMLAWQFVFTLVWPNISARIVFTSIACSAVYLAVSWAFYRARDEVGSREGRLTASLVAGIGLLTSAIYLARAIYSLFTMDPSDSLFEPDYVQEASFVVVFLSSVLLSFGFVLMNLMRANVKLEKLATFDSLTGVYNRHAILDLLREGLAASDTSFDQLSLLMIDLDRFKFVNDRLGHPEGDRILALIARSIQEATRGNDLLGRVGGDEFLIIMPGTGEPEAAAVADRLRVRVRESLLELFDPDLELSLSIGVAGRDHQEIHWDELVRRTDMALYQSKRAGGDRVTRFGTPRPRT